MPAHVLVSTCVHMCSRALCGLPLPVWFHPPGGRAQRFQLFVALLIGAAVLMGLAVFVFLPMVVFVPSKFAMSFTIGSLMFFGSFMVLRGPRTVARQLLAPDRIVFTSANAPMDPA